MTLSYAAPLSLLIISIRLTARNNRISLNQNNFINTSFVYIINSIIQLYEEAKYMNILMIIGIILGGGVSVASTVGITVGIFGTIVYKFYRKLRFGISMFD
jgi:hypothetical protein